MTALALFGVGLVVGTPPTGDAPTGGVVPEPNEPEHEASAPAHTIAANTNEPEVMRRIAGPVTPAPP